MSIFQKITVGIKFLFGGFESAVDYVLGILNGFLKEGIAAEKLDKALALAEKALYYLKKYGIFCPAKWKGAYDQSVGAVEYLYEILQDHEVTSAEVQAAIEGFKAAYKAWMTDDCAECKDCVAK